MILARCGSPEPLKSHTLSSSLPRAIIDTNETKPEVLSGLIQFLDKVAEPQAIGLQFQTGALKSLSFPKVRHEYRSALPD